MTRLLFAALLLGACAPRPAPEVLYRDTTRQVYSIAEFEPARIKGHWVQVAGFGNACHGGTMDIGPVTQYALCLPTGAKRGAGAMTATMPGRFDLPGVGPFWVLWADADNRTLVIGAPSGRYGMILNRDAKLPADRLNAARDILKFNGYDTTKLNVY
ncbi:MAG: lipocalin family protein [Cypionkella sp.]